MDRREREARLQALQQRRARPRAASDTDSASDTGSDALDDFIDDGHGQDHMPDHDHDHDHDHSAVGGPKRPRHGSTTSFFRGRTAHPPSSTPPPAAALNDAFFQQLVAQIDVPADDPAPVAAPAPAPNDVSFLVEGHSAAAALLEHALPSVLPPPETMLLASEDDADAEAFGADWCNEEELRSIETQLLGAAIAPAGSVNVGDMNGGSVNVDSHNVDTGGDHATEGTPTPTPTVDPDCQHFYWFDAHERQPNGPVYLFGKLRDPAAPDAVTTACVVLDGLQRNVFFLPRPGTEYAAVHAEVTELMRQHGVARFGCKRVTRHYAFGLADVPAEAEYLKLAYAYADGAPLPTGLTGATFARVLGAGTGALEALLVKRRMMGPCWLRIRGAVRAAPGAGASWCRAELRVADAKGVAVPPAGAPEHAWPAPPLSALALSLRTVLCPATRTHELVAVAGLVYADAAGTAPRCTAAFAVVRDPAEAGFPARFADALHASAAASATGRCIRIEPVRTERALLNYLLALLARYDPDLLLGHNFWGFDLGVLLARMRATRVDGWARVGRLRWTQWPRGRGASLGAGTEASWAERQLVCGRVVCDTFLAAKEHVRARNYALGTLTAALLGLQRAPFDPEATRAAFAQPPALAALLAACEMDAFYIAALAFQMQVLPLTLQLTQIAGNLWARTLAGARAERNELLLLHEFHRRKFLCPDRPAHEPPPLPPPEDEHGAARPGRRRPQYAGGLVLEPRRGLYDRIVLLLDFNSLYPSIIQEYNICFTTVPPGAPADDAPPALPDPARPPGVLPCILRALVERRRAVKSLMRHRDRIAPAQYAAYHVRQQALKLTANAMYGCLGFAHSRFYAKPLAVLITATGRDILQRTVCIARDACQLDVIYGDTDSIMVSTRTASLPEARALAARIKKAVNDKYRLLEIELDGIFQRLLLLRKKKYAALVVDEERPDGSLVTRLETKGLDLVRRDWCPLSVDACAFVLDAVMRGDNADLVAEAIHACLRRVAADLAAGAVPLASFVISKNLTKDPAAYADAKAQPHVAVALRMRQRGLTAAAGDTIPYVVCLQGSCAPGPEASSTGLAAFAYHPDEVARDPALSIDHAWYLQTQLHPPIARLCEHIDGTDSARLAACLGLDPRKFRTHSADPHASTADDPCGPFRFASTLSDDERFAHVARLSVTCPACRLAAEFPGIATEAPDAGDSPIRINTACSRCRHRFPTPALHRAVQLSFRAATQKYYDYWMRCDEVGCGVESQRIGVYDRRCPQDGCKGTLRPLFAPSYIYTHLQYLRSLFTTDKLSLRLAPKLSAPDSKLLLQVAADADPIRALIDAHIAQCAYPVVDFRQLFSFLSK